VVDEVVDDVVDEVVVVVVATGADAVCVAWSIMVVVCCAP
jgi:hypothetical protein